MKSAVNMLQEITKPIIGMVPTRVKLGHGSFLTFDFGKDRFEEIETRRGKMTLCFGEWYLWIYMCAWRIELNGLPLINSNDQREAIEEGLYHFKDKPLVKFEIINSSFDAVLQFDTSLEVLLFSSTAQKDEVWKFFTPDGKVFCAGPATSWKYEDASKR